MAAADEPVEFQYRLPRRVGGWRPGAHAGTGLGAGMEFVSDPEEVAVRFEDGVI